MEGLHCYLLSGRSKTISFLQENKDMKLVLFIVVVVVIFVIYKKTITKIDDDCEKAMNTPGRANYLRDNYPILVAYIESLSGYEIEFEREDLIRYANSNNRIKKQIIVQQFFDMIVVGFILENVALKEWKLKKRDYTDVQMADAVKSYLMYKA